MEWVPESMDERAEAKLLQAIAEAFREAGPEKSAKFVEDLLLAHKDELLKAPENNPARIQLLEILNKHERGFE